MGVLASVVNVCALSPTLALNSAPPRLPWVGCDGSRRPLGLTRLERELFSTSRSSHCQCHFRTGEDPHHSSGRTFPRRPADRMGGRCERRNRDSDCVHGRPGPRPPAHRRDWGLLPGRRCGLVTGQQSARIPLRLQSRGRRRDGPGGRLYRGPGCGHLCTPAPHPSARRSHQPGLFPERPAYCLPIY
jgi:hypothetical protein